MKYFLLLLFALILISDSIIAQQWKQVNPPDNAMNGTILASIANRQGLVFAAGNFTDTGKNFVIAQLNNGVWTKLGPAKNLFQGNSTVYALALDSLGNLYCGGAITDSTGNYYIAKWDGNQWSELGPNSSFKNITGQTFSISADKAGNIYAAGELIDSSGYYYVCKWDGNSWAPLGSGTHALHANSLIYAVIPDANGNVYAAGHFTNSSNKYYVARWNGTDWMELGNGSGGLNANSQITSLALDSTGNLYAAGDFTDSTGHQYVAKWDGQSWSELGTGAAALNANGTINHIAFEASGKLYAGGMFTDSNYFISMAQWSGSSWSMIQGTAGVWPVVKYINTICASPKGPIYAGGEFTDINGNYYVAQLSNGIWSEAGFIGTKLPSPANRIKATAADTAGHLFVILGDVDFVNIPIVWRWDGRNWNRLNTSTSSGYEFLTGLAPDSLGNMYAIGSFSNIQGVAKWNGVHWDLIPLSASQFAINSINHVATDKKGNVYISGVFNQNGRLYNLAKWDGQNWTVFGVADIYYFIVDTAGTVYAATRDFDFNQYNVTRITENSQSLIGGIATQALNANTWVQAMALDTEGHLYVGGGFSDSAGNAYVAKWNGNSWSKLGTGISGLNIYGSITGLVFDNAANLYVSGSLLEHSLSYMGKWNGQNWVSINDGNSTLFGGQNDIPYLCRDSKGSLYAVLQQGPIFSYIPANAMNHPIPCDSVAVVSLSASQTQVTAGSNTSLILTATATLNGGINTTYQFATDGNFNNILQSASAENTLTLDISKIQLGLNTFYVRMQTTDSCNDILTATDSISILKKASTGVTDIDFPNSIISASPNPFHNQITISGINSTKSYTFSLLDPQGNLIQKVMISGQDGFSMGTIAIPPGVYRLEVYDNTKNRKIGVISLIKI